MSTRTKKRRKAGRPALATASRRNLYIPDDVYAMAEEMAAKDRRSVSNYLAALVLREAQEGKAAA